MNWNRIEGKWEQLKHDAKSALGKLSDDLRWVGGKRDKQRSSVLEERAQHDADTWHDQVSKRVDRYGSHGGEPPSH